MSWINTPASLALLREFDQAFPNRDHASDGTIGDGEHAQSVSDHNPDETGNTGGVEDADSTNEVHARDVDADLRRAGWSMERVVQLIVARCRSGAEKRLRYVIFNRRIWSASDGWVTREYDGDNPHDKHAHFSFRYGSGKAPANPEAIVTAWGILAAVQQEEDDVSEQDVTAALEKPRPYKLARISERGWADTSLVVKIEYMFEALVAAGLVDIDGDGAADDSTSVPARLARIEAALARIERPGGTQ